MMTYGAWAELASRVGQRLWPLVRAIRARAAVISDTGAAPPQSDHNYSVWRLRMALMTALQASSITLSHAFFSPAPSASCCAVCTRRARAPVHRECTEGSFPARNVDAAVADYIETEVDERTGPRTRDNEQGRMRCTQSHRGLLLFSPPCNQSWNSATC